MQRRVLGDCRHVVFGVTHVFRRKTVKVRPGRRSMVQVDQPSKKPSTIPCLHHRNYPLILWLDYCRRIKRQHDAIQIVSLNDIYVMNHTTLHLYLLAATPYAMNSYP